METSGGDSDPHSRRYRIPFLSSNFIRTPLSSLLEYSGILQTRSGLQEITRLGLQEITRSGIQETEGLDDSAATSRGNNGGEVSIRIVQEHVRRDGDSGNNGVSSDQITEAEMMGSEAGNDGPPSPASGSEAGNGVGGDNRVYDIRPVVRWFEEILPFSLLLLIVFIRQHLQGFFVTIWIAVVMFKSNDILRKQTALKGERKISVLVGTTMVLMLHVIGIYWLYRNDGLLYPLVMLPPTSIPPFWHAVFIIMVNDTLVRQAAMIFKCMLLMCYKNRRGRNYRKQGQMLTTVEYFLLLYRALLPTTIWYPFFFNREYGSLFSFLIAGLYVSFKLASFVEKVKSFFSALKALLCKELRYGSYATTEQVIAAGDLCTICQEKIHAPILLRCKHIFCEDCVSEWFERERTCPLCRALVVPADLRSFGDGSTSLFFQLF